MKSIAPRASVYIIWQNFSNRTSAVSTPPREVSTISNFNQERITAKADELRSAIRTGNKM
jgi:hypothetical protein